AWSIFQILPSVGRLWTPLGDVGLAISQGGWVERVSPGSPGAQAGVRAGDRIDIPSTPFESRRVGGNAPLPYERYTVAIRRANQTRLVSLFPIPEQLSAATKLGIVVRTITPIIAIVLSGWLVIMRPTAMAWGLFLFFWGLNVGSHSGSQALLPFSVACVVEYAFLLSTAAAAVGFLLFMTLFPTNAPSSRFGVLVLRALPFIFLVMAGINTYVWIGSTFTGWAVDAFSLLTFQVLWPFVFFLGVAVFLERYIHSHGMERQRIRWVGAAFGVGLSCLLIALTLEVNYPGTLSYATLSFMYAAIIIVPISVAYAVLKHHVIDVRFVISRTVVYAAITGFVVVGIGLVDWLTSTYLHEARLALALDALVTIAIAFTLNRLHRWVEATVDFLLFRDKYQAETFLSRLGRTLLNATQEETVDRALVRDPYRRLQLASAALFRKTGQTFVLCSASGIDTSAAIAFEPDHDLVRFLCAENTRLSLSDLTDNPFGHASIAIPIHQGPEMTAFVVYGIHRDGTVLDPDEVESLERLCACAAQAYTYIEVSRYRAERVAAAI
ncbi:MAG TPA: hypothetical protein VFA29_02290, partial [Candidatus Baltobacteraceae bacterium]|nr:hypothetical protein [Candidatus Baltobacteraceae bacterium]